MNCESGTVHPMGNGELAGARPSARARTCSARNLSTFSSALNAFRHLIAMGVGGIVLEDFASIGGSEPFVKTNRQGYF